MAVNPLQFVRLRRPRFGARAGSLAALAALGLIAGCKPVGPDYSRPTYTAPPVYKEAGASTVLVPPPNPAGGGWQPASPSDGMIKGKWWEIYNDPQLNQLEERIAGYNQGLRQALETYKAATEQITIARADLYPTLSAGPGFTHIKASANKPLVTPTTATNYNDI